jgi:hypothetical protein
VRKTLRFRAITYEDFENYFFLNSPGYFFVKDFLEEGEVSDPLDVLEVMCLTNKLFTIETVNRIAVALKPYGKDKKYLETCETNEGAQLAAATLGRGKLLAILEEVGDYVRAELQGISSEDEKVTDPTR